MGVAEIVEPIDQLTFRQRLPTPQLERPGVDAREDALALAVEAGIEQACEADVVVAGREEEENDRDGKRRASSTAPSGAARCLGSGSWRRIRSDLVERIN